jgi:hypothetical protein
MLFYDIVEMNTNSLFGSIGREYCLYFYILSVIAIVLAALIFIPAIYVGITEKKGFQYFLLSLAGIIVYLMAYLQNRLLYNMCSKTL